MGSPEWEDWVCGRQPPPHPGLGINGLDGDGYLRLLGLWQKPQAEIILISLRVTSCFRDPCLSPTSGCEYGQGKPTESPALLPLVGLQGLRWHFLPALPPPTDSSLLRCTREGGSTSPRP